MKRLLLLMLVLVMVFAFSPAAFGVDTTAPVPLMVKARVSPTCAVWTSDLVFPVYIGEAIQLGNYSGAKVDVLCTTDTRFTIRIDGGAQPNSSGVRRMENQKHLGNYLKYRLYYDDGQGGYPEWKWSGGQFPPKVKSNGSKYTEKIYGKVPNQGVNKKAGVYKDIVNVIVVYGP